MSDEEELRKRPRSPTFGYIERPVLEESSHRGFSIGILAGLITLVLIIILRVFVFQTFKIPSGSMSPTLEIGDHIVVNKAIYGFGPSHSIGRFRAPQRGDIIVFYRFSEFEDRNNETHYIKRIVAVPNDTVEVRDYRTYVNGRPLGSEAEAPKNPETSLENNAGKNYGPILLAPDEYYVLGDNAGNSKDSRFYGPIHFSDIEGRAEVIYWSWYTYEGNSSIRWERIGKWVR